MKQEPIIPLLRFQSESLSFKVQTIKHFAAEQDDINAGPHSHNYYEMVWLIEGSGQLNVDLKERPIGTNSVFCLRPNQAHQFQIQPEMEGFIFSFTDSFFKMDEYDLDWGSQASLFQLFSESPTLAIENEMEEDLKDIVSKMIKECDNKYSYRTELLKRYFKIFLIYLTRTVDGRYQSTEQSREAELVRNFMEMLDKNFKEKKMVAEYASQLLVTPNYLNGIVKKNTGFSAGKHIRHRIVLEAKRMGRYSDAGMKEIAYNLGFLDSAHFSKFFKTFAGINFSEFKRGPLVASLAAIPNRA